MARVQIAYKNSLRPTESFVSKLYVQKEGVKYVFHQAIFRNPDNKLCVKAKVDVAVLVNGKLVHGLPELDKLIEARDKE